MIEVSTSHPAGASGGSALLERLAAHREEFLAFVRRRTRSGADAEDLLQQAYERAAAKIATLRQADSLVPWFYRVIRRLLAEHHAGWALQQRKLQELGAEMADASPEEVASCACALGMLDRLRPEYADILKRVDLDEEPISDVAGRLGVTANNATVRLHRARRRLRQEVEAVCGPGIARAQQSCADCECEVGQT